MSFFPQQRKCSDLAQDLQPTLKRLNEVWIMKLQAGFQFSLDRSTSFSNNFSLQGKILFSSQLCSR